MRVAVIGAGIGGLTLAIALRQRGIDVEVYERSAALTDVGAGISLWANALKALHQLGLKAPLDALRFTSDEGALRTARGAVLTRTSAREVTARFGMPVTVFHRAELLDVLRDAARGIPLHLDHDCRDVAHSADGASVILHTGRQAHADVVVGADGLRSAVRASLKIPGEIRYAGYTAWRGIAPFQTAGLRAGETLGCGRRFGLVPIAGDRVYWYATDNAREGEREEPARAKARLTEMFSHWHAPIPSLIEATAAAAILRNDIYDRDPVDRWGEGRVTLLGDAAHPMTPNLGQGGCQAIEDALVLARCLAEGGRVEASLRRYEAMRIPRTRYIVCASRRIGRAFQIESRILCRLRDFAMRMTPAAMSYRSLAAIAGYEGHLRDESKDQTSRIE
jgi:2-polyprenyl-6-methoxyphenol hydroxylase-like FAD-dependent oxidoreductase